MGTKTTAFISHKIYEPYRATRLWNEVVRAFRNDLPRGWHRKRMKNYEDCFVASEAVDWLLKYLQTSPHFGPDVCRQQAVQLLQKFLQCNLIEELSARKGPELKFEDNRQLYRVKKATPLKSPAPKCLKRMMRAPLANLPPASQDIRNCVTSSGTPDLSNKTLALRNRNARDAVPYFCNDVLKSGMAQTDDRTLDLNENETIKENRFKNPTTLSPQEVANIWKSVLWNKLSVTVAFKNLEDVLNPSQVLGQTIIHNVTNVQRNGIVTLLDKTDDIPNWIMCAMKCLAKWPNASGSSSCLPNYPGFEKDVFKVVQDYFLSLDESLIPCQFYGTVAALYNFASASQKSEILEPNSKIVPTCITTQFQNVSDAITSNQKRTLQRCELTYSDLQVFQNPTRNNSLSTCSSDAVLELCQDRASYCFETAFSEEDPLTRIIRKPSCTESNTRIGMYKKCQSSEDVCRTSELNQMQLSNRNESSDRICSRHPEPVSQRNSSLKWLSLDHLTARNSRFQFEKRDKTRIGLKQVYYGKPFDPSDNASKLVQCGSLGCISIGSSVNSNTSTQPNLVIKNPYVNPCKPKNATVMRTQSTVSASRFCSKSSLKVKEPVRCSSALDRPAEPQSSLVRTLSLPRSQRLVKCFQLILLLIPVANRRKLHLLLRFLNKVKINRSLQIFPSEFAQIMMVRMFWRSILRSPECSKGTAKEEALCYQVVDFLLDHCEAVLASPVELKMEVDNVITLLCQSRMRNLGKEVGPRVAYPVTFCEQVTSEMYEDQKVEMLHSSLVELLDEIVRNPLLSKKERLNKLQKFRKQYPSVYKERFPTGNGSEEKRKSTLFGMLRSLRF